MEVLWVDSAIQNGQVDRYEYPKPELIRSVGWLVEETSEHLLIARDDHKDDEYRGLLSIPKECVRDRREYEERGADCPCGDPVNGPPCTETNPCGYRVAGMRDNRLPVDPKDCGPAHH